METKLKILICDAEVVNVLIPARQLWHPVSAITERVTDPGDMNVENPSAAKSLGETVAVGEMPV